MENQTLSSNEDNNLDKPGNRKALYGVLVIILVAAIAAGAYYYSSDRTGIVQQRNVDLPADGRQALESQVTALQGQVDSLAPDAKPEDRFQVYYKLAEAKFLLGNYGEALKILEKIAAENENNATLHSLYTTIYREMGDIARAKESAKRTVDLDANSPQAWVTYINLQEDAGQDALKSLYQEALGKTSDNIGIVTAYAQFLEKIGDKQGAIEQWKKAIEVFPQGKATYEGEITRLQQS